MHIAIVLPAFNVAPYIRDALQSVLDQTHTDWSLVVVDDGSRDATSDIVTSFLDQRIRLLRQQNAGVSAARNLGIAAVLRPEAHNGSPPAGTAPGAVLFLDGDDWLAPDALALLADTLGTAPEAVAVSGRYARVAANGTAHLSPPTPAGDLLERLLIRNLFANGGHLLIRRAAIEAAGDFRTDLSYGEDWEYFTRLALLGAFQSVPSSAPVLSVRERPGSAYLSHATNPTAYRPALQAIYCNPAIADRVSASRLAALGRQAEAETAWAVGRELIRHGRQRDGHRSLRRSVRNAPSLKRLILIGVSCLRVGPFRRYQVADR